MPRNSIRRTLGALPFILLLSLRVEAQQSMTTEQLLENAQNDNAYAAAMFITGWAAGTAEQLRMRAEELRTAGVDSSRVEYLFGLTECLTSELEVADLWAALRAALQNDSIDPNTSASIALNNVAVEICGSRGF